VSLYAHIKCPKIKARNEAKNQYFTLPKTPKSAKERGREEEGG